MPSMSHDAIVRAVRDAYGKVRLDDARNAWIASLGSAPLRYRTILAHYAFAANFPHHAFEASPGNQSRLCAVCGLAKTETVDAKEDAAFREQGDFRMFDPAGAAADLKAFAADKNKPKPTPDDIALFDRMLETTHALPLPSRASALVKAWSFVPRTNKYARENLVATFGACGLLDTLDHPGHLTRWVSFWEYEEAPSGAGDMRPPEAWWQRHALVNRAALDQFFRVKGVDAKRFRKRRWKRMLHKHDVKVGRTTLSVGDRIGIRLHDRHYVGVVLGTHWTPVKSMPVIEFHRGTWDHWPTDAELAKAHARLVGPHFGAPTFRREPLAFEALEKYGTHYKDAHWEVLAHGVKPPPLAGGAKLPLPDYGFRVIRTSDHLWILYTLSTVFASPSALLRGRRSSAV